MFRLLWLLLLFWLCFADTTYSVEMSDIFRIDQPTCANTNLNDLLHETDTVARACLAALHDLRDGTWQGRPRKEWWGKGGSNEEYLREARRSLTRYTNAHLLLGTPNPRENVKVTLEGFKDPRHVSTIKDITLLVEQLLAYINPQSNDNEKRDTNQQSKPFLACSRKLPKAQYHCVVVLPRPRSNTVPVESRASYLSLRIQPRPLTGV